MTEAVSRRKFVSQGGKMMIEVLQARPKIFHYFSCNTTLVVGNFQVKVMENKESTKTNIYSTQITVKPTNYFTIQ